jgi:hypothetical protein
VAVILKYLEEEMQAKKQVIQEPSLESQTSRVSSRAQIISFAIGAASITLILFAYYACTWQSAARFQAAIDTCGEAFCDFAEFYYPMGESIFHSGLPLTGFVYSPFIAILMAAFPPLGFKASLVLWGVLQALSIILYLHLFRQLVPARLPIQLLFVVGCRRTSCLWSQF